MYNWNLSKLINQPHPPKFNLTVKWVEILEKKKKRTEEQSRGKFFQRQKTEWQSQSWENQGQREAIVWINTASVVSEEGVKRKRST